MNTKICNGSYTVISGCKAEDLAKLQKYKPEALVLRDDKDNDLYRIGFNEKASEGSITKAGAIFNKINAEGKACFTALCDAKTKNEERKDAVKDLLAPVQELISKLEKQIETEGKKLETHLKAVEEKISITD